MGTEYEFEEVFADALSRVPPEYRDEARFVPGAGPLDAPVMFVGEAPGAQEVEEGVPFVGNAGRRLDAFLARAGIDREEAYLTNVLKVRPPGNRDPRVGELEAWRPVLEAELNRVDPVVVVPLGSPATGVILDTDEGVTDLRGRTYERDGRLVIPTFHPAATFYDESITADIEADLETVAAELARAS